MAPIPFTTLIDAESLAAHLADSSYRILDCRFALNDAAWGEQVYTASHIPGAVHADLKRHLAGHPTGRNGRHPLPPVAELCGTFGRLGIDASRQVVAYDQDSGIFASRLWWMLRWLGHGAVAVLDGGFAAWVAAGHPVSSAVEPEIRRDFTGTPRPDMVAGLEDVVSVMAQGGHRLVDARSPERFNGEVEPIDRVPGHIPGARNYFYMRNLDAAGRFLPAADLRERLTAVLDGVPAEKTIAYCGSGVTAAHNLLAMEHAGLRGAKLYPGSWSEWSSDERRPVAKGPVADVKDADQSGA
jgi:thiosulfate/3-mercaptopyruvate sulfurtransferase